MYDLCVIGGGASGISCAITAGRLGLKVLLIEKNNKLGKKLYATGNGKCNLTNNIFQLKKDYNSNNENYTDFLSELFYENQCQISPNNQLISFIESIGVSTIDDHNYIYPRSAQASSVVWAMIDELKKHDVKILLNTEVIYIQGKYPSFKIKTENEAFTATQVVLSCGGAAYKSLGGTYKGYELANSFGHTITNPIRPCLCGLCVEKDLEDIAGVRSNATISLMDQNNHVIRTSCGELQFTKQGLSGICIYELSSQAGKLIYNNVYPKVNISFFNTKDSKAYKQLVTKIENEDFGQRTVIGFLNGYINDKIAAYACKLNKIDGKTVTAKLTPKILLNIVDTLNNMEFNVKSLYDMEQAQVTAGGIEINEINPKTMESKLVEGLYIVGELLDIDGICGGYNLTFAMLSGIKAGKSINDKNKSN